MKNLLIYIPTYNGSTRIGIALTAVFNAIDNLSEDLVNNVFIHVKDNCSTDNTIDVCKQFIHRKNFIFDKNEINVGLIGNLRKGIELDRNQYYTWMIGDDDLISPNSLVRFFNLLDELNLKQTNIDLFHVNYCAINISLFKSENIHTLIKNNQVQGWFSNQKFKQPTVCKLADLIDPKIETSTLGSTMNFIFNSALLRDHSDILYENANFGLETVDMNSQIALPLPYILTRIIDFNYLNCLVDPFVYTYVSVGHQTWTPFRAKFLGIGVVQFLIESLHLGLINHEHLLYALCGHAKTCKKEFKEIILSQEFEKLDSVYKDTLLQATFWDA
jgi:glycosyltransferase involved in cell wall biosynthesis